MYTRSRYPCGARHGQRSTAACSNSSIYMYTIATASNYRAPSPESSAPPHGPCTYKGSEVRCGSIGVMEELLSQSQRHGDHRSRANWFCSGSLQVWATGVRAVLACMLAFYTSSGRSSTSAAHGQQSLKLSAARALTGSLVYYRMVYSDDGMGGGRLTTRSPEPAWPPARALR